MTSYRLYFDLVYTRSLNILVTDLAIIFHNASIAHGHGNLRIDDQGQLILTGELTKFLGADLPRYQPLMLIPVEHDLTFLATTPDGHRIGGSLNSLTDSGVLGADQMSITARLSSLDISIPTLTPTKGTLFHGFLPFLEQDVYDRPSKITDSNRYLNSGEMRTDWFEFESARAKFVGRSRANRCAEVLITTPFVSPEWVGALPKAFLTAMGLRVARKLSWLCVNRRSENIDMLTIYSRTEERKPSGLLQTMILKPATNIPLVADAVQFLMDFEDSPIGSLQYAIWDSDTQPNFVIRELAISVAIEGLSDYVIDHYAAHMKTSVSMQIGKDKSVLRATRKKFKTRMAKQTDLKMKPYYSYLVRAVESAKPYTAPDKIKKAVQVLAPSTVIGLDQIDSWKRTRNSAAHARSSSAPITQDRFDDYINCEYTWHWLICEMILSNPLTSSKVRRMVHRAAKNEVKERAFYLWEEQGRPPGRDLQNWLDAERQLTDARIAAAKQHMNEHYQDFV